MRILAIESSCDETAAAVVDDEIEILSSVVASQLDTHAKYGGVVPELASREHLRAIVPVVRLALEEAHAALESVDAIACTAGPGLVGSLLVGLTYAKGLAFALSRPLIAVNHIEGHIHAVILESRRKGTPVEFPALALVASGGHTHLFRVEEDGGVALLGRTRDDAAGEAYDKVAKLLGFGYPGGPIIDQLAPFGNGRAVPFTAVRIKGNPLDFSFSGLKTAVLRWTEARDLSRELTARRELLAVHPRPTIEQWRAVTPQATVDMLASFQRTVIDELLRRAALAAGEIGARAVIISGGVASNQGLRAAAEKADLQAPVHFTTRALSTDNAVMIAAAAFGKARRGEWADLGVAPYSTLKASSLATDGHR